MGNVDTYGKFYADTPDYEGPMRCFVSWEVSTKANKWLGQGLVRWQHSEFDARFGAAEVDLDSIKRAGQFIRMNDLVVGEG